MPCRGRSGFSLFELLIVAAIMGILAALLVPNLDAGIHDRLEAAAQALSDDLSYGANLAIANNSSYRFTFDIRANRHWLEHAGSNPALDALPGTPFRSPSDPPERHNFSLADLPQIGSPVRLLAVVTTGTVPRRLTELEFDSLGAVAGGEEAIVWLVGGSGAGARYISIRIDPFTGQPWIGETQAAPPVLPSG